MIKLIRPVFWRLGFFIFIVGAGFFWIKNNDYIIALSSIASEGVSESNYKELPALIKNLPGTKIIFSAKNYRSLYGNERVKKIYKSQGGVSVDLRFVDKDDDAEKRSAKVTLGLGETDLTNTILFTKVQIRGEIVGKGHQKSRIQLELTDINNKRMMGPKIPANIGENYLILRPTTAEPIPTGSFQDNFDLTKVQSITIRFIVGRYPDEIKLPANGKLIFSEILEVTNLSLASKFFKKPDLNNLTKSGWNLEYELRKLKWKAEKNNFFVGVNYPWNNYGWDVGKNPYGLPENSGWSVNESKLTNDFQLLKRAGIEVVRIYIFFDLRTGLEYKDGHLVSFDKYVKNDIEAIFRAAGKSDIKIIPVLFDFGIADGQDGLGEHPELFFSPEKANFLVNIVRPLLIEMNQWNDKYGKPVFAIELMNEPDNMAMLLIPGHFESLKIWFRDLINIVHQETSFKITLGSHSIVDMQRWWSDLEIDIWQFHFYKYMFKEHEWWPQNLKREKIKMPGLIFCGELEPYDIKKNIDMIKANGYDGVLFWSWNTNDGFKLSPEQINEASEWIDNNKKEVR